MCLDRDYSREQHLSDIKFPRSIKKEDYVVAGAEKLADSRAVREKEEERWGTRGTILPRDVILISIFIWAKGNRARK